ncbi:hypothetical protein N5F07_23115 [Pseudomonas chengduensis]|uniref:Lipoprotein n=1 Tax=Pseudomonas sihuiensis TaxID=1274359 RepID=A0A1H2N7F1_9PSED|nr:MULTISPECIES: hypothetical protein [Pseudomonas]MDH1624049.1 hypothetical protein [Pseudomonas chengduensis]MDH1868421.1 hypothetical protein [Pseudomonas chengduensis]SDV01312.1 hypothetical protein SAMN05216363_4823 [Pseudomonas sihuiensis]
MNKPIIHVLWLPLLGLPLLGLSLSACSSLAPLTGERFTLEGELPADFALKAQAHYDVANNCNGRSQARSFESDFQSTPQQYRFNIPVSYRDGLCEMRLGRVGLFIHGRYGDKDWQRTYDNGGLTLVETLPLGAPSFEADGTLTKQAECTWLFQLSKAHSRQGQISKLLSCKGAGAYLVADELPGKTVRLNFRENPEEEPSYDRRWIKTDAGWRPCQGTESSDRCQNPPAFKTFQMNGQECTVYPNCTE